MFSALFHCHNLSKTSKYQRNLLIPTLFSPYFGKSFAQHSKSSKNKQNTCIISLFSPYSHLIPTLFPPYSHLIPTLFWQKLRSAVKIIPKQAKYLHNLLILTLFSPYSHLIPTLFPPYSHLILAKASLNIQNHPKTSELPA